MRNEKALQGLLGFLIVGMLFIVGWSGQYTLNIDSQVNSLGVGTAAPGSTGNMEFSGSLKCTASGEHYHPVLLINNDDDTGLYQSDYGSGSIVYRNNGQNKVTFANGYSDFVQTVRVNSTIVAGMNKLSEAQIWFGFPTSTPGSSKIVLNNDSGAYDAMEFLGPADADNDASVSMMKLTTSGADLPLGAGTASGKGITIGSTTVQNDNVLVLHDDGSVSNPASGAACIYFDATADQIIAKKSDGTTVVIADFSP